jgi:hypothetical protein
MRRHRLQHDALQRLFANRYEFVPVYQAGVIDAL